ncbi:DUF6444 domain-containing protein [Brevibacterium spongiae]|uniref:DUF6444 domain-containing protein n=1 Tax=Brevibacterium spongiae TaxID=2909672 RepID=UPI003D21320A
MMDGELSQTPQDTEPNALYETLSDISDLLVPNEILEAITARARSAMRADLCYFSLVDPSSHDHAARMHSNRDQEWLHDDYVRLEQNLGVAGKVAATREVFATNDYFGDPSVQHESTIDVTTQLRALMAESQQTHRAQLAELQESHRAQVAEMHKLNEVLAVRVAQLEARLGKSPRNSDKPPASEGYEKPAPKSRRKRTGRSSGGQPGHKGRTLSQVADPDRVITHQPDECGMSSPGFC